MPRPSCTTLNRSNPTQATLVRLQAFWKERGHYRLQRRWRKSLQSLRRLTRGLIPTARCCRVEFAPAARESLRSYERSFGYPCGMTESAERDQLCFWSIRRTPNAAASMAPAMYPGNCGDHSLPIPINRPAQWDESTVASRLIECCPPSSKS